MDLKEQYVKTAGFLRRYQTFWYEEILNFYPETLEKYPKSWIKALDSLTSHELWQLDSRIDYSFLKNTPIFSFIEEIRKLSIIPKFLNIPAQLDLRGIKKKKSHEISNLIPYLGFLQKNHSFSHIIDIGGGVGHLSRVASKNLQIPCICLDCDKTLQEKGKTLLDGEKVTFVSKGLGLPIIGSFEYEVLDNEESQKIFSPDSLALGLHSCGALSIRLLEHVTNFKSKGLVNFPCCYLKLDPNKDVNLSAFSKANPLSFSKHALTLASRSHSKSSFKDFLLKEQVKKFRYTFHLLLFEKFSIKNFKGIGHYPLNKYHDDFSLYAFEKLDELQIKHSLTSSQLNSFLDEKKDLVRIMFLCNILRWQTGRVLEIHLLLDRAIFLEENGLKVNLFELFNEEISPRNIGLFGLRNEGKSPSPQINLS